MSLLWIRNEIKAFEKRAPLIPLHAKNLIKKGHSIVVESSKERIFSDEEYVDAGCEIVPCGNWVIAPKNSIILGIKHLPVLNAPLTHTHIYFAHAYDKNRIFHKEPGVTTLMSYFKQGAGLHYDPQFLINQQSKRVLFFGNYAGYAGVCIALFIWAQKYQHKPRPFYLQSFYTSIQVALDELHIILNDINTKPQHIIVIGANGNSGRATQFLLQRLGLSSTPWNKNESKSATKCLELLNSDIFFNCISVQDPIKPFLTLEQLKANHKLSIIVDITCETEEYNPLPIYSSYTNHTNPSHYIATEPNPIDVIAIDNLPSFFPYESSIHFSTQLLPHLEQLLNHQETYPMQMARKVFRNNIERMPI